MAQAGCAIDQSDYRVAIRAYEDGLIDPAMAGFIAYLQKCPQAEPAPQVHYLLGELFYKRQRFDQALQHAIEVLSTPAAAAFHPYAALLAGQCLIQLGQLEQAASVLRRAIVESATGEVRTAALYWLGEIAFQQQQYAEARTFYQGVLQEQSAGPYATYAQYSLGWVFRQLGDLTAALEAFSAFLTQAPTHEFAPQARFTRAMLLRETGQFQEARAAFQQLAQTVPTAQQDEMLFWWAETAYQQGLYDEARTVYQRLFAEYPQSARAPASLYGWGWAAVQQHQCAAAVQPWEWLLQREPQWSQALEVHYQLGMCYAQLEQSAAAQTHLQQVLAAGDSTANTQNALLQLAMLAFQQGDYAQAAQHYNQALSFVSQDDSFRLHYLLGESYAALGKQGQAVEHWQQVLTGPATLPFRAHALFRLGNEYIRQQNWQQALPFLRQLWFDFPGFPERLTVARQLVYAYTALRQCAAALPFYEAIVQGTAETSQQHAVLIAKALCLFELGRYADVVRSLEPLLASGAPAAGESQVLYTLGQAYMHLQQYQEALTPFTVLHQHFPTDTFAVAAASAFAVALEETDRRSEALSVWKAYLIHAALRDDERLQLQLHAGRLALQEGQLPEALDFLASVRQAPFPPLAAEALFWSGEAYFQQQQWDLAAQVYQEILDSHQTERHWGTLAQLRLGTIYEQQRDWDRALQSYQTLLTTVTDTEIRTTVQQRITAIEAGRVSKPQSPATFPSEG
jgi:TolA-binding protein